MALVIIILLCTASYTFFASASTRVHPTGTPTPVYLTHPILDSLRLCVPLEYMDPTHPSSRDIFSGNSGVKKLSLVIPRADIAPDKAISPEGVDGTLQLEVARTIPSVLENLWKLSGADLSHSPANLHGLEKYPAISPPNMNLFDDGFVLRSVNLGPDAEAPVIVDCRINPEILDICDVMFAYDGLVAKVKIRRGVVPEWAEVRTRTKSLLSRFLKEKCQK